jgi:hypothetical protein
MLFPSETFATTEPAARLTCRFKIHEPAADDVGKNLR